MDKGIAFNRLESFICPLSVSLEVGLAHETVYISDPVYVFESEVGEDFALLIVSDFWEGPGRGRVILNRFC